ETASVPYRGFISAGRESSVQPSTVFTLVARIPRNFRCRSVGSVRFCVPSPVRSGKFVGVFVKRSYLAIELQLLGKLDGEIGKFGGRSERLSAQDAPACGEAAKERPTAFQRGNDTYDDLATFWNTVMEEQEDSHGGNVDRRRHLLEMLPLHIGSMNHQREIHGHSFCAPAFHLLHGVDTNTSAGVQSILRKG